MTNTGEVVEELEPLYIAGENIKCRKQFGSSSKG
jgi:hypothetical protein